MLNTSRQENKALKEQKLMLQNEINLLKEKAIKQDTENLLLQNSLASMQASTPIAMDSWSSKCLFDDRKRCVDVDDDGIDCIVASVFGLPKVTPTPAKKSKRSVVPVKSSRLDGTSDKRQICGEQHKGKNQHYWTQCNKCKHWHYVCEKCVQKTYLQMKEFINSGHEWMCFDCDKLD